MALFLSWRVCKFVNMMIGEYYTRTVEVVEDLTGVSRDEICSKCRLREVVDARWLVVWLMSEAGYYPRQIAGQLGITTRMAQKILQEFLDRVRYSPDIMLRNNLESAEKRLRNN